MINLGIWVRKGNETNGIYVFCERYIFFLLFPVFTNLLWYLFNLVEMQKNWWWKVQKRIKSILTTEHKRTRCWQYNITTLYFYYGVSWILTIRKVSVMLPTYIPEDNTYLWLNDKDKPGSCVIRFKYYLLSEYWLDDEYFIPCNIYGYEIYVYRNCLNYINNHHQYHQTIPPPYLFLSQ